MIYQLVYMSRAKKHFDDDGLLKLFANSREANKKLGVTGILIYDDRVFIQLLEGDKVDVKDLMTKISKDPRHEGIVYLISELSPFGRLFPKWSMGFRHMRVIDKNGIDGLEENGLAQIKSKIKEKKESMAGKLLLQIINLNNFRSV